MPRLPATKPQSPTAVSPTGQSTSQERVPFNRLRITAADLTGADGHIDPEQLIRHLGFLQDNADAATQDARSNPLGRPYIKQGVKFNINATVGSVTRTGTAPPAVKITGTPLGKFNIQINVVTNGAPNTTNVFFNWSTDGGSTWNAGIAGTGNALIANIIATAFPFVLGTTGLTAWFPVASTYTNDNVFTASTTCAPLVLSHGLGAPVAFWHPIGVGPNSQPFLATKATFGSSDWPSSYSLKNYLVLYPGCTGTYDIALYGG